MAAYILFGFVQAARQAEHSSLGDFEQEAAIMAQHVSDYTHNRQGMNYAQLPSMSSQH
jgi:hypothetical protein